MDYQDSLFVIKSQNGKGSTIADLRYDIKHLKLLNKDYDLQIGLKSFRLTDILFEIIDGQNTISWSEIKYPTTIRTATAVLTPGFYTKTQLITLLETAMDTNTLHGIAYFVSFDINNRITITTNKAPTDKQFYIIAPDANSGWVTLGFNYPASIVYVTTIIGDNRIFYDTVLRLNIYSNIIKSSSYSTCDSNNNNLLISNLEVKNALSNIDSFSFFDNNPIMHDASDINSQSIYIKFYNCETLGLQEFPIGSTYSIEFVLRQKYKASLIRKSMMITKKEIVEIVQELLKEKQKNTKANIEKVIKKKKPELPKKK